MVASKILLASVIAASGASAGLVYPVGVLLARQAPGSPAYNCHDNCGQSIILARAGSVCDNAIFEANYGRCLQCAGPDNEDIWRWYGNTLSTAASACGMSTTPLSGDQPDVGPAIPADGSGTTTSASSAAATEPTTAAETSAEATTEPTTAAAETPAEATTEPTTAAAETPAEVTTEPTTAAAETPAEATTEATTAAAETPAEATTAAAETGETAATSTAAPATEPTTAATTPATPTTAATTPATPTTPSTVIPAGTGVSGSNWTNATSTYSTPTTVVTAGASMRSAAAGFVGAAAFGAAYILAL